MMPNLIKLKVMTHEKVLYEGEIKKLATETEEGKRTILPTHSPLIAILRPSISTILDSNGEEKEFVTSSGILRVTKNEIIMLCDAAEWPWNIDKERAEASMKRAEDRLHKTGIIDKERAELALKRSISRIKASKLK